MVLDKNKELTEDEKFELQLQAEQELGRLARTYTILERNRAQKCDTGGKLLKQRKVLDIFKREQKNILTDLAVASADARKLEDEKKSKELKFLLNEYDEFDAEINQNKSHINEIDGQIKMVKKKVLDLRSKQITDEMYQQRVITGEKTVQTLENKLEVQIKKFCQISSDNIKLREEINHLLMERNDFNKIWDTLINNLAVGKKFMLDLIEQATIAYDQREEWVSKLQILRTKAHNDLISHIQDMRVMQRKMDDDAKLQEFFSIKCQKRIMKDLEEKERQKRLQNKENMEKKLERYLQILITIKEFTGEERVHTIANNFVTQEEENFAMFKYINHLNKEMEDLTDSLAKVQIKIDEQRALNDFRRQQQETRLEDLNNQFEEAKKAAAQKADELKNVDQKLKTVLNGIGQLFKMFRCKNDPLIKMLGGNQIIHNHNVLLYLEILERNIEEAMVTVFYKEKNLTEKKKGKQEAMTLKHIKCPPVIEPIERIVLTNPCPLCVEHEQVSDVIDTLQFALTKEEIQAKLNLKIEQEGANDKLHNVSACHLPKSRQIIQKRYQ
ncbi:coiled-coil domain-containing protein 63-like [Diorhabda carinulata]|uniref:coiled-coil domain-containing protein 63-like n=1 Tax=Diorhabda carinulata TaxID=1163345 RepID=UPI0025A04AAD|nr:coiled-coil domain-containing protein 63-like [Diorhabda carinulata]